MKPYIAGDFAARCRRLATMAAESLWKAAKLNPADLLSLFPYSLVPITPYIAGDFAARCRRLATMAAEAAPVAYRTMNFHPIYCA
jgi:hypothetical protein